MIAHMVIYDKEGHEIGRSQFNTVNGVNTENADCTPDGKAAFAAVFVNGEAVYHENLLDVGIRDLRKGDTLRFRRGDFRFDRNYR